MFVTTDYHYAKTTYWRLNVFFCQ